MAEPREMLAGVPWSSSADWVDEVADRFEAAWKKGGAPRLADFLGQATGKARTRLLLELIRLDLEYHWNADNRIKIEVYLRDWPELGDEESGELYELIGCEWRVRLQHGEKPTDAEYRQRFGALKPERLGTAILPVPSLSAARVEPPLPERIGRYLVRRFLGEGTFGVVYLGHDDLMDRPVAIKVSRSPPVSPPCQGGDTGGDARRAEEGFLSEARNVARLKHPSIVTVHDFGVADGRCFIVYEYIAGTSLRDKLGGKPLGHDAARALIADVADALHAAHEVGLIHRDIKPANILLDAQGRPHLIDFGLGVREVDLADQKGRLAGTCLYMAPEMIRGEGHRIDARYDIYSLGVVFYELLCGRVPYSASTREALFNLIVQGDARAPRHVDRRIPRELERICQKAIAARISDRYASAKDLANELREASTTAITRDRKEAAPIIPKGLRSFGPEDSDFFLSLLPGPRDADQLPESIRFWKSRIENRDADATFSVGMLYGPSGCGKTSLIQAGLLPRLAPSVRTIYLEASPDQTEARILHELRRLCPDLADATDLVSAFAVLRRGTPAMREAKVLIVLDQFEQWLHARATRPEDDSLVRALRQADGSNVQFLLMARDDFWLAISRLFQELEIRLVEGHNTRFVDLFDLRHARRVLELLGQAYGCLPPHRSDFSAEQQQFLEQATRGVSQAGKVVSVALSVFADMMKGHSWTPCALKKLGGTSGVGVTFLEEAFSARTACPEHRLYEAPARALLAALLPGADSDIKGRMRSRLELLQAAGLEHEPPRFERLLDILDRELRIITPTEPAAAADSPATPARPTAFYQLTHDFLVPPLRQWLRYQKLASWRGRAELCLDERAAEWSRNRDARFLPSLGEYLRIQLGVSWRKRKAEQRDMMRMAGRRFGSIAGVCILVLSLLGYGAWEVHGRLRARGLVQAICSATAAEADKLISVDLPPYQRWARRPLQVIAMDRDGDPDQRLRASLACLPEQLDFLEEQLLDCSVDEFLVLRSRLAPYGECIAPGLWKVFHDEQQPSRNRFHAGLALAAYSADAGWSDADCAFLVRRLLEIHPDEQSRYRSCLEPLRHQMVSPLRELIAQPALAQAAVVALADFGRDDPKLLATLASEVPAAQFDLIFPALVALKERRRDVLRHLRHITAEKPGDRMTEGQRIELGSRRAGAAITLARLGSTEACLDVLRVDDDLESLTQFVHQLKARGLKPSELLLCFDKSSEESVRYGLLLALGEFSLRDIPESRRRHLVDRVVDWYQHDPSSAIHGAADWLLRSWGCAAQTDQVDRTPLPLDPTGKRQWFVQRIGAECFTFVVFPAGEYVVGSAASERERIPDETRHTVRLSRAFAISDQELTVAQWQRFAKSPAPVAAAHHAAGDLTWERAVAYCHWLTEQAGLSQSDQCYEPGEEQTKDFHPERAGFRLPTEAEWEIACRCRTRTAYSFGSERRFLDRYGWFVVNSGRQAHDVKTQRPNVRGLFDMHGNVWEWCQDWYQKYPDTLAADPLGRGEEKTRVYRGGGFDNYERHGRSSCRISDQPTYHFPYVGMRLVCTVHLDR